MEKSILILDQQRIDSKLQRMAYQIWEHNSNEQEVMLIGIQGTGLAVAQSLAQRLQKISPLKVTVHTLTLNKKHPLSEEIVLKADPGGQSVVLVDDVANSGKTMLYALKPILAFEPKKILMAVLVDRKHKSFPVSADIVGHSVATTLREHIEIVCEGDLITAAFLK